MFTKTPRKKKLFFRPTQNAKLVRKKKRKKKTGFFRFRVGKTCRRSWCAPRIRIARRHRAPHAPEMHPYLRRFHLFFFSFPRTALSCRSPKKNRLPRRCARTRTLIRGPPWSIYHERLMKLLATFFLYLIDRGSLRCHTRKKVDQSRDHHGDGIFNPPNFVTHRTCSPAFRGIAPIHVIIGPRIDSRPQEFRAPAMITPFRELTNLPGWLMWNVDRTRAISTCWVRKQNYPVDFA